GPSPSASNILSILHSSLSSVPFSDILLLHCHSRVRWALPTPRSLPLMRVVFPVLDVLLDFLSPLQCGRWTLELSLLPFEMFRCEHRDHGDALRDRRERLPFLDRLRGLLLRGVRPVDHVERAGL